MNALLVNIEVWHNVLQKDIEVITQLDNYLMRQILKAHSKVPIELLYLETGTIPVDYVIKSRRVNYLHTILRRDKSELIARVYNVQKEKPSKGDWSSIIKSDMETIGLKMSENEIAEIGQTKFKTIVKKLVRNAAFKHLQEKKEKHTKIRNIEYKELKLQNYYESRLFTAEEASILFNLRGQCLNGVKMCAKNNFQNDLLCKLGCQVEDTLSHVFECPKLKSDISSQFLSVFLSVDKQKEAVTAFQQRMATRTSILEADHTSTPAGGAGETHGGFVLM